jgi:hypothetical protein
MEDVWRRLRAYSNLKNKKDGIIILIENRRNFHARLKAQRDEGGGRILLGNNTGSGTVVLRPIIFQYAWVWISAGQPFMYLHVYLIICSLNFDMCRNFQKVTIASVGECL